MNLTPHSAVLVFLLISLTGLSHSNRASRKHRKADVLVRFKGKRFTQAAHYLPLNGTTRDKKLVDVRGNSTGVVQNGVKQSTADQIGDVLTLDGKDSYIELTGFKDKCIVDPSFCREGLSVAFWIKYIKGEFIISSGHYTKSSVGPGFRFVCENCGPHLSTSSRFLLEVSTHSHRWRILLDSIPRWWFHFAFTFNRRHGLKFYKNGKIAVENDEAIFTRNIDESRGEITIGKPNSLFSMFQANSYGEFSIGHLAIWTYELSSFDVEIAFMSSLRRTTISITCCKAMKEDPCIKNPCHDGATCHRMEDRYKCICTDINTNGNCIGPVTEPCEDTIDNCAEFVKQSGYCGQHRRRMREICPKACNFCHAGQSSESATTGLTPSTTLVPNPSPGSQNWQTPLATPEVPTSPVLGISNGDDNKGTSQGMLVLVISAAIGGLVLLVVLSGFILTRFYRQRKGEFVPDKTYPTPHSKQNGEIGVDDDGDYIAPFNDVIDPSTPRITDVPHKPTRAQSSAAGGPAGAKKPKKPMGVKVTYKPPKWD